jgi:hypothetical protein
MSNEEVIEIEIEGYAFKLFKRAEAPDTVQFIATSKNQEVTRKKIIDDFKRMIEDFGKWEDISAGIELIKKL